MFLIYLALPQIGRNLVDQYPGLGTKFSQALILEAVTAARSRSASTTAPT